MGLALWGPVDQSARNLEKVSNCVSKINTINGGNIDEVYKTNCNSS